MSADLFAAFGLDVSPRRTTENKHKDSGAHVTSPDVLIPEIGTLEIQQQHNTHEKESRSKRRDEHPLWRRDHTGTDVLFDAKEEATHDDEEFGDFEDANAIRESHPVPSPVTNLRQEFLGRPTSFTIPMHDLLGLDQEDPKMDPVLAPNRKLASANIASTPILGQTVSDVSPEDDWGDFSAPATHEANLPATENTKAIAPLPSPSGTQQAPTEDDWDTFEDGEIGWLNLEQADQRPGRLSATQVVVVPQLPPPPHKTNPPSQRTLAEAAEIVRPSNIPPPAILLQLLPGIFHELRQTVTSQVRQDPSNHANSPQLDIASKIVQAFTVAARMVSGRALRWKRDAILAQSMRIGPATSKGGGRGMKLAAIDKNESLKEEKEAADVISAWEKSAHLFNATISKAGIQRPLMTLYLSVRPRATSGLDVLKANHACALCGVNRDERVPQVDLNVEDSFGEYWIEHWGHRACRDFWTTYKGKLHQR